MIEADRIARNAQASPKLNIGGLAQWATSLLLPNHEVSIALPIPTRYCHSGARSTVEQPGHV
jgi:hypothetical protein